MLLRLPAFGAGGERPTSDDERDAVGFIKRKRRVVNKRLQWGAVAFIFFIAMALVAFHTWLTYASLSRSVLVDLDRGVLTRILLQDVGVTVFVMVAVVIGLGLSGTHRLAGPLYRFQEALRKMQKGDISEVIRLRNGDLLMEFMGDLNLALANLREIAAEDKQAVDEALYHLNRLRGPLQGGQFLQSLELALRVLGKVGKRLQLTRPGEHGRTAARRIFPGAMGQVASGAPAVPAARARPAQAPAWRGAAGAPSGARPVVPAGAPVDQTLLIAPAVAGGAPGMGRPPQGPGPVHRGTAPYAVPVPGPPAHNTGPYAAASGAPAGPAGSAPGAYPQVRDRSLNMTKPFRQQVVGSGGPAASGIRPAAAEVAPDIANMRTIADPMQSLSRDEAVARMREEKGRG